MIAINGKKVNHIAIAGKEVTGLAYGGKVIYKKDTQPTPEGDDFYIIRYGDNFETVEEVNKGVDGDPKCTLLKAALQRIDDSVKIKVESEKPTATDVSTLFDGLSFTEVDLSDFNTLPVTNMAAMFRGMDSLSKVTFGRGFDASKCWSIQSLFDMDDWNLREVDLSMLDLSSVTTPDRAFYYCERLRTLDISNWNMSKVYSSFRPFDGCESLANLNFGYNFGSGFTSSTTLDLSYCSSLTQDSVLSVVNGLADVTSKSITMTVSFATSVSRNIPDSVKKIATDKGWVVK